MHSLTTTRSFFTFFALLAFFSLSTQAAAVKQCTATAEIDCTFPALRSRHFKATRTFINPRLTNGERLARGLPLKPPSRRGDYNGPFPSASPSPAPKTTHTGFIELRNRDTAEVIGFVGKNTHEDGQFRATRDESLALQVEFDLEAGASSGSSFNLRTLNVDGPFIGLIQGRENADSELSVGSWNYLYFGTVYEPGTRPGDAPTTVANKFTQYTGIARTVETSVWNVDLTTNELSVQWINSDLSIPPLQAFVQGAWMYASSDVAAFNNKFPSGTTPFTLHFIPKLP